MLFDRRDHELIRIVGELRDRGNRKAYARKRYYLVFHPNGIKEMTETKGMRMAYAVAHLLDSLEVGQVDDRLNALRMLRAEAIDTTGGPMPKNTARVLLQLMKDLVRFQGTYPRQLALAHDFRTAVSGKPRIVRRLLKRYRLLEMPEQWHQLTFDDHVHDVNTKGRKTPTHLIMDAWIKGIRRLRIIHYNFIEPRFAAELLSAAKIMDMDIRIGIEFSARFRGRYIQLIWVPRGFADTQDFLCFLEEPRVVALMDQGRAVSRYQQRPVMALLQKFNTVYLPRIRDTYQLELAPIAEADFLKFVGSGQKSRFHLSEYIQNQMVNALQARVLKLRASYAAGDEREREKIGAYIAMLDGLDVEATVRAYLRPENNPDIPSGASWTEDEEQPELLTLTAPQVLDRLTQLRLGYRITLNLTDLCADEVLELLYDCQGGITRLEIFNLKDYTEGRTAHVPAICRLQQALNHESIISLKQVVRNIISGVEASDYPDRADRVAKLTNILHDLAGLKALYQETPLKSRIGSDSTGRSYKTYGMGLAVRETLPLRAQREIHRDKSEHQRMMLPIRLTAYSRDTFVPHRVDPPLHPLIYRLALTVPFLSWIGFKRLESWQVEPASTAMSKHGNIVTLGGIRRQEKSGFGMDAHLHGEQRPPFSWRHLNSHLRNVLKVTLGFIPAFATFFLTKRWWLLAYFGAFIWFGITGLRNVLQSVLGGGGFRRSPLLHWNDYVSWDRITDSLLYTGFSVPLLDYLVKTVLLDRGFGITTASSAVLLYSVMALANGVYLFTHNVLRGLPRGAAVGNLFRSILSIPIAVGLNALLAALLPMAGVIDVDGALQKWAAIISKAASDGVAGIIEGLADRYANIRLRIRDYRQKFHEILDVYADLELLYPEVKTFHVLNHPADGKQVARAEATELEHRIMLHALDLLYFWMYQPRSQSALKQFLGTLSEDERYILVSSQFTLQRDRDISRLFIDGIFGGNFRKPLSFYLSRYPDYLSAIKKLGLVE
jgi:hypothetical protein